MSAASTDERTKKSKYVIEATTFEELALWKEYSLDAVKLGYAGPANRAEWMGYPDTHSVHVGGRVPTRMEVSYTKLCGKHVVMFWRPTSECVDYEACEAWLRDNVPAYFFGRSTDAVNFYNNCLVPLMREG